MSKESCQSCQFWTFPTGLCRRYPPRVYGDTQGNMRGGDGQVWTNVEAEYPVTGRNDWCGEYKGKKDSEGR